MRLSKHTFTIFASTGREWNNQIFDFIHDKLGHIKGTVQLYDDYCSENFVYEGFAYYPLTVVCGKKCEFFWLKWETERTTFPFFMIKGGQIQEGNDTVPEEFVTRLKNRTHYFNGRNKIKFYFTGYTSDAGIKPSTNNEVLIEQRAIDHIMMQFQNYLEPRIKRENWLKEYDFVLSLGCRTPMYSNCDGYWYYTISIEHGISGINWWVKSKKKLVAGMTSFPVIVCETLADDIYDFFIKQPWIELNSAPKKETETILGIELKCPEFLRLPIKENSFDSVIKYIETRGYDELNQFTINLRRILNYNPEIVEQHAKLRNLRDSLNKNM